MKDFRVGYLYSLAPIHCGGEGDLGNILDIVRETHTDFPYIPGSSLRGGIRRDLEATYTDQALGDRLFGRELGSDGEMGVHQVWFGDARLLWVPMRTFSQNSRDVFMWVSCPTLLRDHALLGRNVLPEFPAHAVGDRPGDYTVADAKITVQALTEAQKQALKLSGNWPSVLGASSQKNWQESRIVLPDGDFQVLLEHSLWTQIRNKIQDSGGAEIFWTDVCIPRDTMLYYPWGYALLSPNSLREEDHTALKNTLTGLLQVGGQANVGRGWVQGWISQDNSPLNSSPLTASSTEEIAS